MRKAGLYIALSFSLLCLFSCSSSSGPKETAYKTVEYGYYPQTAVSDEELISSLNGLTSTGSQGYYSFNGGQYLKMQANPLSSGYKFSDGLTSIEARKSYYFKVEPIKWRVLKEEEDSYLLLSQAVLDCQAFYSGSQTRTYYEKTVCPNNYQYSALRTWLTISFYARAFYADSSKLLLTQVDNSSSSSGEKNNSYSCADTEDYVFLPSYKEMTDEEYGFISSPKQNDPARVLKASDYARIRNIWMSSQKESYGACHYWLRSPNDYGNYQVKSVSYDGLAVGQTSCWDHLGTAMCIRMKKA